MSAIPAFPALRMKLLFRIGTSNRRQFCRLLKRPSFDTIGPASRL